MSTSSPTLEEIEQHRAAVTRYIHSVVRDAAEAEDLAQETLLRAHRQRTTLRDPAALESWLYQIASHVSIDRLRQRARVARRQVDAPIGQIVEVEEQVVVDSLSPAVRDGLQAKAGKGKLVKVESLTKHGKLVAYEAQVVNDGKRSEVQVGPDGKPLAHEE
jgi:RNA polymerase sigma factor (sigma-70 family)